MCNVSFLRMIARSPEIFYIQGPILAVVEAKKKAKEEEILEV